MGRTVGILETVWLVILKNRPPPVMNGNRCAKFLVTEVREKNSSTVGWLVGRSTVIFCSGGLIRPEPTA